MRNSVGQRAILSQKRAIAFFQNALSYAYLGHWKDRSDNTNIEKDHLSDWLGSGKTLFDANREIYEQLRYGVKVRSEAHANLASSVALSTDETLPPWIEQFEPIRSQSFRILASAEVSKQVAMTGYIDSFHLRTFVPALIVPLASFLSMRRNRQPGRVNAVALEPLQQRPRVPGLSLWLTCLVAFSPQPAAGLLSPARTQAWGQA